MYEVCVAVPGMTRPLLEPFYLSLSGLYIIIQLDRYVYSEGERKIFELTTYPENTSNPHGSSANVCSPALA